MFFMEEVMKKDQNLEDRCTGVKEIFEKLDKFVQSKSYSTFDVRKYFKDLKIIDWYEEVFHHLVHDSYQKKNKNSKKLKLKPNNY